MAIDTFHVLFQNAMQKFKTVNTVYPSQVIIYRDGVASSQMQAVWENELKAIYDAVKSVQKYEEAMENPSECQPKIEFIVVQKRVNARFWMEERDGLSTAPQRTVVGKSFNFFSRKARSFFFENLNLLPIDHGIVSNQFWDFYLVSTRAPPRKCANPIRCIVVFDGLDLAETDESGTNGVNDLEFFTYGLCCLYYNWPGAVKIPHVIKYADKIAYAYQQQLKSKEGDSRANYGSNKPNIRTEMSHHFL